LGKKEQEGYKIPYLFGIQVVYRRNLKADEIAEKIHELLE
jgi:hypothetical protein